MQHTCGTAGAGEAEGRRPATAGGLAGDADGATEPLADGAAVLGLAPPPPMARPPTLIFSRGAPPEDCVAAVAVKADCAGASANLRASLDIAVAL